MQPSVSNYVMAHTMLRPLNVSSCEDKVKAYFRIGFFLLSLMEKKFNSPSFHGLWRQNKIKQRGKLSKKISYQFHGIGCTFEFHKCSFASIHLDSINLDYWDQKIVIDHWKVGIFLKDNFNLNITKDDVAKICDKILQENPSLSVYVIEQDKRW